MNLIQTALTATDPDVCDNDIGVNDNDPDDSDNDPSDRITIPMTGITISVTLWNAVLYWMKCLKHNILYIIILNAFL